MIVVGGEALVDLVPASSTVDGELAPLSPRPGGGPYNVAIVAGRQAVPVRFLSRIGADGFGDHLVRRLHEATVDLSLVQRGPEPTTLAVAGIAADGSADYTFHVHGTADRLFADPGPLPADTTILSLGTLSLVLEPGASAYEAVLRREAARGVLTVLDPNVRPGLIADPTAYRARFASWLPRVGVLTLSEDDARWLGENDDPVAAATGWLDAGPAAVVLTRGARGLCVLTARGRHAVAPVPTRVADTIGAGDTVHGTLLAWLHLHGVDSVARVRELDESEWRDCLTRAARAAAITVSRVGAQPPYAAELRE